MRRRSDSLLVCVLLMFILFFVLVIAYPSDSLYTEEYIVLSAGLMVFLFISGIFFHFFPVYIFEPVLLAFVLYLFVFFVAPIYNILTESTDCMGYEVMGGCVKATIIFLASYVAMLFGYYGTFKKTTGRSCDESGQASVIEKTEWKGSNVESVAFLIWLVSFCFGCVELFSKGMSLSYFLTLGLNGDVEDFYGESAFGFLSNFRSSMITAWVYLFVCNRKSWKTKICGILTLEFFLLRGFRHAIFVLIFAPIIYSFVKDNKKPRLRVVLLMLVIIVLVMGVVQFVRGDLRHGSDVDWSDFDSDIFAEALQGNFDVYKTFYGMIEAVPERLNYQWGLASIVSTVTMVIPRRIWPSKPVSPLITNLGMFCGNLAADAGYAMPNISEYYLDFGWPGCVIGLFIFGQLLQKLKYLYKYRSYDRHGLVLYAVFYPALMQVILRGYSPSYVYLLLFYAFPVIVMKLFVRNK